MIDRFIYKFCGAIDSFCDGIAKMLESKPKRKKR